MSIFTNSAARSKEEAAAYTQAVLGLVGERDPLDILHTTPAALREAVAGLSETELSAPERAGKWSVRQVLRHLADSDVVWAWRLRMVLSHDRPAITGYDQDLWAERLHYDDADAAASLAEFEAVRRGNLRLVAQATPEDLARVGVHSERGEESVAHMVRMYAGHDVLHLRQVERIRGALRAATTSTS